MIKAVIIGGGVGAANFTRALKDLPLELTTIVSSFDDGGSTGLIRRDYGGIALGDFRNCLLAGSAWPEDWIQAFGHRFGPGHLHGANVGNVVLKSFFVTSSTQQQAVNRLHDFFNLRNRVILVSFSAARLRAKLSNGKTLVGQREIADYLSFSKAPIKNIALTKKTQLNPEAEKALLAADYIMFAPGHFFTSLMPHLCVRGFGLTWQKSRAKKIWFVNLLAHKGQDSYYTLQDYLKWFRPALGSKPFDWVVANKGVSQRALSQVADRFEPVRVTRSDTKFFSRLGMKILTTDLLCRRIRQQQPNDFIARAPLRHDRNKLTKFINQLIHA